MAAFAQAAAGRGGGDPSAEQFVQTEAQKIIAVLADKGKSKAEKEKIFRQLVDQVADVPKVTNFVLGRYARTITPAQHQEFSTVFREYAENVYQSRIDSYHGEGLKVTGSVARKPGDAVVNTVIGGGQIRQPLPVSWRVLNTGGGWRVVDVQFKGVWLAITEQQDFVSTIDKAGGNVDVLIAQLKRDIQQQNAGK